MKRLRCVTEGARRLRGARGRRAECTASVPAPGHAIEDRPSVAILAPRVRMGTERVERAASGARVWRWCLGQAGISRNSFRNKAVFTIIPFAKFRAKLGSDLAFTPPKFKPGVGRGMEEHRTGP